MVVFCMVYVYVVVESFAYLVLVVWFFFFFFKQKTAYEMRISDWSSDVCSSDLLGLPPALIGAYMSVAYLAATVSALVCPGFIMRFGGIRASQIADRKSVV